MASGSKRPPNLTSLTPNPKHTITVEEWESLAPIGDIETRSASYVQAANERSTLPLKVRIYLLLLLKHPLHTIRQVQRRRVELVFPSIHADCPRETRPDISTLHS